MSKIAQEGVVHYEAKAIIPELTATLTWRM